MSTDAHSPQDGGFFRPLPGLWLIGVLAAGAALRLLFLFRWGSATPDSLIYADIAKNWLQQGVYGLSESAGIVPTYIRLPGYPGFLAAIFAIAGPDHYNAVRFTQAALDLLTAFVVADLARRVLSRSAAAAAFVLYALCPFLANYAAVVLTETLAIFATALALDFAVIALDSGDRARATAAALCGLATALGILLRPDGGGVLITIGVYLLYRGFRDRAWARVLRIGVVVALVSLAPLVPWTWRNWQVLHRFQPLAPVAANAPDEFVALGFERWERTWLVDYAGLIDAGFKVDGEAIEIGDLPNIALGSGDERDRTIRLIEDYNAILTVTPALDRRFAALAGERIRRAPLRYYLLLPALRAADVWLRPRTELLPVDAHFWDIDQGWDDVGISLACAVLNLAYLVAAALGLRRTCPRYLGLLLGFCLLRTAMVTAFSGPEPRYVLECFPVVLLFAGAAFTRSAPAPAGARSP